MVLVMLAILSSIIFTMLNPQAQLDKARDAQKEHDLKQVSQALDAYYNDNNSYPDQVPFGSSWKIGSVTYMQQVPSDTSYYYIKDPNGQWAVLFAKLNYFTPDRRPAGGTYCELETKTNCLPQGYGTLANYCIVMGQIDSNACSIIFGTNLSGPTPPASPSTPPSGTVTPGPTATPTAPPVPTCDHKYDCRSLGGGSTCNDVGSGLGTYCTSNCDNMCH